MYLKYQEYQKAIKLRFKGKSYREIAREVEVSKGSVSRWCKNLKLPPTAQKILAKKTNYPKEKFAAYNQLKHRLVQAENKKIIEDAINQIRSLSEYELLLIGAALYWAEGYNAQKNKNGLQLSNSNPYLVALFLRFLREIIKIPEEKFRVSVKIHPNISPQSAVNFWAKVTNIPKECFRVIDQISRASRRKRPRNTLPHGTLDLRVNGRQYLFRVKGWIDGLKHQSGLS